MRCLLFNLINISSSFFLCNFRQGSQTTSSDHILKTILNPKLSLGLGALQPLSIILRASQYSTRYVTQLEETRSCLMSYLVFLFYFQQPTLVPNASFSPGEDAKRIRDALRDPNKEVGVLVQILTGRVASQRQEIATVYKDQFNKVTL